MLRIALFNILQLLVSAYAFRRGGPPERVVGSLMIVAAIATACVAYLTRAGFDRVMLGLLVVDALFFLAMCMVAAKADRFWPMWIAALQFDALAIHGVRAYDPHILPFVYAWSGGQIAYPMLLLLTVGTWRHQRRVRLRGVEPGWSRHERRAADAC